MPNFLIIGAAKGGTTSMYAYLSQHPQVFMPKFKEPWYFAWDGKEPAFRGPGDANLATRYVRNLKDYQALFGPAGEALALGEASTMYFHAEGTAERIRASNPAMKLILMLRNPVDRAFSQYRMRLCDGKEPLADFGQAVAAEEERIRDGWSQAFWYVRRGFYHRQLQPYDAAFPTEQIKIWLYEELAKEPERVVRETYAFLGVDPSFSPNIERKYNVGATPASAALPATMRQNSRVQKLVKSLLPSPLRERLSNSLRNRAQNLVTIKPEVREKLTALYRDDILRLQDRLGRDLGGWLSIP